MSSPQGYPLWAVRACSIEDSAAEIGLVVGWEEDDSAVRRPIVATLGPCGAFPGTAYDWRCEVERSDRPGERWIQRVELYATLEQAQERAPDLFREVGEQHDSLWPEDVRVLTEAPQ